MPTHAYDCAVCVCVCVLKEKCLHILSIAVYLSSIHSLVRQREYMRSNCKKIADKKIVKRARLRYSGIQHLCSCSFCITSICFVCFGKSSLSWWKACIHRFKVHTILIWMNVVRGRRHWRMIRFNGIYNQIQIMRISHFFVICCCCCCHFIDLRFKNKNWFVHQGNFGKWSPVVVRVTIRAIVRVTCAQWIDLHIFFIPFCVSFWFVPLECRCIRLVFLVF